MASDRTPTQQDLDTISLQLGRPARDVVEVGARCVCGNPLVATTAPRLSNGIPFPTTFYLTHPVLTAAVSRLEAAGTMAEMTERLGRDEDLAVRYRAAHENYLAERDRVGEAAGIGEVPEIARISAGGMPDRVKCLHVLVGHGLAVGPGANPLGDEALETIVDRGWWTRETCRCQGAWDTEAPVPSKDLSRHVRRLERQQQEQQEQLEQQHGQRRDHQHRPAPDGGRVATTEKDGPVVAAIDCGTNSIRLLVAQSDGAGGLLDEHREMRVNRLGEGVDATGRLAEAALERTFAAAQDYAMVIEELGASRVRFVATSASRDAENREDFVDGIRRILGVTPEVISGAEEAELSFRGAASALSPTVRKSPGQVLVVDLGGGSTEFVLGTAGAAASAAVSASVSTPMGCVRFSERHLHTDPPTADEVQAATTDIEAVLDQVEAQMPLKRAVAVVGVAGSVTTVTAAGLGLDTYDPERIHGAELELSLIDDTARDLLAATRRERAELPYMHPGRVDVIGAGALVWTTLLQRVARVTGGAVHTAIASEHDILDGIALALLD